MEKYQPISCDYYDNLEIAAMRGVSVEIVYTDAAGAEIIISEKIQTIQARKGEEFLITENGQEIRLDYLISVGGKVLPGKKC